MPINRQPAGQSSFVQRIRAGRVVPVVSDEALADLVLGGWQSLIQGYAAYATRAEAARASNAQATAVAEASRAVKAEDASKKANTTAEAERDLAESRTTIAEALLGVQSSFLALAENRILTRDMLNDQRTRLEQGKSVLASDKAPKAILPDLTGMYYAVVEKTLADACTPKPCFTKQEEQWKADDAMPVGSVLGTNPRAGTILPWGAAVTITVSQGAPLVVEDPVHMEFVAIPGGPFDMGSETSVDIFAEEDELKHLVLLTDYYIGRYEVTNTQYAACVKADKCEGNNYWGNDPVPSGKEDEPVVNITWTDAVNFTRWLNEREESGRVFRLCTEAEWEKACRGPNGLIYPWGDRFDASRVNVGWLGPSENRPVGRYSPAGGDSPYGVADMGGNVWEWVADWYNYYDDKSPVAMNPQGPERPNGSNIRVVRGGAFDYGDAFSRCADRDSSQPEERNNYLGFRVCVSPGLSAPGQ